MNILFLTTHLNTGGITSYLLTLGESLVNSGHKVWVASSGGNCESRFEALGIKHLTVNIRTKSEIHPKLFLSLKPLKDLVAKESIDVIHAQTRVTQVLGFFLSRSTNVSMITTCHGFFKPRFFRKIFPCWGKAVIAISKPVENHLRMDFKIPQEKIYLINNGIDLKRFRLINEEQRLRFRGQWGIGDYPLIGIIARLSDVKGIDVLIKAMPLILQELPQAQLLIAGQGPQETFLKQLTNDLSLAAKIHFKSTINQTPELLACFDVFVMPSLMEGLGLSVMEAQACGIPVVASRVGGLIDLIEDGKNGYLVPSNDPNALARRIIDFLRDKVLAQGMAKRARLDIEQHFSAELMTVKTIKIYEQYSRR